MELKMKEKTLKESVGKTVEGFDLVEERIRHYENSFVVNAENPILRDILSGYSPEKGFLYKLDCFYDVLDERGALRENENQVGLISLIGKLGGEDFSNANLTYENVRRLKSLKSYVNNMELDILLKGRLIVPLGGIGGGISLGSYISGNPIAGTTFAIPAAMGIGALFGLVAKGLSKNRQLNRDPDFPKLKSLLSMAIEIDSYAYQNFSEDRKESL